MRWRGAGTVCRSISEIPLISEYGVLVSWIVRLSPIKLHCGWQLRGIRAARDRHGRRRINFDREAIDYGGGLSTRERGRSPSAGWLRLCKGDWCRPLWSAGYRHWAIDALRL